MNNFDFFSKPFFANWVRRPSPEIKDWFKKENEFLKKNIKKNSVVLDIGCGFGRHMKLLAKPCKKVVGVDINKTMVKKAKRGLEGLTNVEAFLENVEDLHFKDECFDYVICMTNTFGDFLNKKLKILKEMKRVLKKNGAMFISIYSERALSSRIRAYKKAGIHIEKIKDGKVYFKEGHITEQFTKKQLGQLADLAKLKYKIIELTPISYMWILIK